MAARSDSKDNEEGTTIPEVPFEKQEDFLLEIHGRFLRLVEPRESGLLDRLRETVMDSDTEEEIMAEKTKKDKARKLWKVFRQMPLEDFRDHCYPILKDLYLHVLEGARFVPNTREGDIQKCIRHVIMGRLKLRQFADLFPPFKGCTAQEYNKITEGEADDSKWDLAFKLCARNKKNDSFIQQLQATLQTIKVRVPSNFPAILSKVFICSCKPRRQKDSVYVSSSVDSSTDNNCSSSISSHETMNEVMGESAGEETQFDTQEQKDACLEELERTNSLIKKASNVRPLFRELTGVRDELSILEKTTKSEPVSSFEDQCKKLRLQERTRQLYDSIQGDFKESEETAKMAGDTVQPFTFEIPFAMRIILLQRRQVLLNEVNEARVFFKQSESLFLSISGAEETQVLCKKRSHHQG